MAEIKKTGILLAILFAAMLSGCSRASTKGADFTETTIPHDSSLDADKPSPFLDRNIARDLDAAFLGNRLHVQYEVSHNVVTLTGDVNSLSKRARAETVAASVLHVQHVVNELRVSPRQFESATQ
jgi:hypothetical protein